MTSHEYDIERHVAELAERLERAEDDLDAARAHAGALAERITALARQVEELATGAAPVRQKAGAGGAETGGGGVRFAPLIMPLHYTRELIDDAAIFWTGEPPRST